MAHDLSERSLSLSQNPKRQVEQKYRQPNPHRPGRQGVVELPRGGSCTFNLVRETEFGVSQMPGLNFHFTFRQRGLE